MDYFRSAVIAAVMISCLSCSGIFSSNDGEQLPLVSKVEIYIVKEYWAMEGPILWIQTTKEYSDDCYILRAEMFIDHHRQTIDVITKGVLRGGPDCTEVEMLRKAPKFWSIADLKPGVYALDLTLEYSKKFVYDHYVLEIFDDSTHISPAYGDSSIVYQ